MSAPEPRSGEDKAAQIAREYAARMDDFFLKKDESHIQWRDRKKQERAKLILEAAAAIQRGDGQTKELGCPENTKGHKWSEPRSDFDSGFWLQGALGRKGQICEHCSRVRFYETNQDYYDNLPEWIRKDPSLKVPSGVTRETPPAAPAIHKPADDSAACNKQTGDDFSNVGVHCHRCGWDGTTDETTHEDGIYCPRCPQYKDDHASLSVEAAPAQSATAGATPDNSARAEAVALLVFPLAIYTGDEFKHYRAIIKQQVEAELNAVRSAAGAEGAADGWTLFSQAHPEKGQQITVRWAPPYEEGEADLEWNGADSVDWKHECVPLSWRPLAAERTAGAVAQSTPAQADAVAALEFCDRIAYPKRGTWDEFASISEFAELIQKRWTSDELNQLRALRSGATKGTV